jgi:hypothetical protein
MKILKYTNNSLLEMEDDLLYYPPITPYDSGLISYYKFDEPFPSSIAYDSYGTNNLSSQTQQATNGKHVRCYYVSGPNKYCTTQNTNAFNFERTDSFTFNLWFKAFSTNHQYATIISKTQYHDYPSVGIVKGWMFTMISNDANTFSPAFIAIDNTLNEFDGYGEVLMVKNVWYNICMTYNGSSHSNGLHFYVNGNELVRHTYGYTLSGSIKVPELAWIGDNKASLRYYNDHSKINDPAYGFIDEFAIFNRVLNQPEIT